MYRLYHCGKRKNRLIQSLRILSVILLRHIEERKNEKKKELIILVELLWHIEERKKERKNEKRKEKMDSSDLENSSPPNILSLDFCLMMSNRLCRRLGGLKMLPASGTPTSTWLHSKSSYKF